MGRIEKENKNDFSLNEIPVAPSDKTTTHPHLHKKKKEHVKSFFLIMFALF